MNLPSNLFDGNRNVQIFLCQPDKTIIGEITPYDRNGTFKFNTYSEMSFSVDRYYNDLFDGETKVNPYYDLIENLRVVYLRGVGHFVIQDVDENIAENESKSVSCFSLEYSTGQKYLESFYVNTGEEGSVETMYHARTYGAEYSIDNYYEVAKDYNPYRRYYVKEYSSDRAYNYVEAQVLDENDFNSYDEILYATAYPNVQFYDPYLPELSLLHLIFKHIPEWKIGHVDKELWHQERTFSEDRTAIYDFLYNTAAETLKFVMEWDSINGVVNFYKTEEDGVITNSYVRTNVYNQNFIYYSDDIGTVADPQPIDADAVEKGMYYINVGQSIETQWDTDIFVSRQNLSSTIDVQCSTDDIKTKLRVTGADTLDIRDVNLGQNYLLNLDYYNTPLWLGEDLYSKYNSYTRDLKRYTAQYKEYISGWSAAYNEYSDLVNHVPVHSRVILVGDEFKELYCVYSKYVPATKYETGVTYYLDAEGTFVKPTLQPTNTEEVQDGNYYREADTTTQVQRLTDKLKTYKVDQQDNGEPSQIAKTDDILLTLGDNNSNSATIRIRYSSDKSKYEIQRTRTDAVTGTSNTISYSLEEWVEGKLTANYEPSIEKRMNLSGFKIKSIGTLGAYFCLVQDETEKANVDDYGIRLLEEKQDTYTKIFITQTEGYMNKEGSECIASDELPQGTDFAIGTRWLDTDTINAETGQPIMQIYNGTEWVEYNPETNQNDYENYARFYENYQKLGVVQEVLAEKQLIATYLLNGIPVSYFYLSNENITLNNLLRVVMFHSVVQGNDYVVTSLGDEIPSGKEGMIWAQVVDNDYSLYTIVQQYKGGSWSKLVSDAKNISLTGYYKDFGILTYIENPKFVEATKFTEDKIYYLLDENSVTYIKPKTQPTNVEEFELKTYYTIEGTEYAVYVNNGTPYVSYAHSQGVYLAKMNTLKELSDMNNYFLEEELVRLSPFIREDEYSDSNFLLTGYESEEEQMNIKQELRDAGDEELKKLSQPKFSFSTSMANILAIPEFAPIKSQFKL